MDKALEKKYDESHTEIWDDIAHEAFFVMQSSLFKWKYGLTNPEMADGCATLIQGIIHAFGLALAYSEKLEDDTPEFNKAIRDVESGMMARLNRDHQDDKKHDKEWEDFCNTHAKELRNEDN